MFWYLAIMLRESLVGSGFNLLPTCEMALTKINKLPRPGVLIWLIAKDDDDKNHCRDDGDNEQS